jgi:hypothetical protein
VKPGILEVYKDFGVLLLRNNFSRFAAIVLLVWLFAAGTAFAQACVSTSELLCEECCTEVKAATPVAEVRLDTSVPAQPAPPWLVASLSPEVFTGPTVETYLPDRPPPASAPTRIPIVFLRLAL